jgi:hypothetical protein
MTKPPDKSILYRRIILSIDGNKEWTEKINKASPK